MARHTGLHFKRKNPPHFQVINFRDIIWMRLKATNGTLASRDKEGGSVWGWPRTRAQKLRTFRRTMFSVGWTCQWASERTFHSVIPDSNSFSSWHCVSAQDITSSKSAQDRRQTKPGNLYNQSDKDNEVWTRTGAMGTAGNEDGDDRLSLQLWIRCHQNKYKYGRNQTWYIPNRGKPAEVRSGQSQTSKEENQTRP